jgi:anthranilate synthase/aminodeoxychorismate synthase-like glutamine amidotransferase
MIVVIDNYDSFTYNLVQYLGELGGKLSVYRNDEITLDEIKEKKPERIVISPGPGRPENAGISNDVIRKFGPHIPILGVCLGHQCLGYVNGAKIIRAGRLMHGKTSLIYHNGKEIFKGLSNPFEATRYHSLIIKKEGLPKNLKIIAWTKTKEVMGIKHKDWPVWGVQFHPESILTGEGKKLLSNFLKYRKI